MFVFVPLEFLCMCGVWKAHINEGNKTWQSPFHSRLQSEGNSLEIVYGVLHATLRYVRVFKCNQGYSFWVCCPFKDTTEADVLWKIVCGKCLTLWHSRASKPHWAGLYSPALHHNKVHIQSTVQSFFDPFFMCILVQYSVIITKIIFCCRERVLINGRQFWSKY